MIRVYGRRKPQPHVRRACCEPTADDPVGYRPRDGIRAVYRGFGSAASDDGINASKHPNFRARPCPHQQEGVCIGRPSILEGQGAITLNQSPVCSAISRASSTSNRVTCLISNRTEPAHGLGPSLTKPGYGLEKLQAALIAARPNATRQVSGDEAGKYTPVWLLSRWTGMNEISIVGQKS